ncbi:flagellar basal body P-ring protein FlgI [Hyphococcus sp.]|jgi:flagellar P-ring protein precursor FlgI|uniref:flagellar basal body P-ring protein FlgI n=1 Tax=Hyphococcus sp. TaxID=2038636 RepID=UPI003D0C2444
MKSFCIRSNLRSLAARAVAAFIIALMSAHPSFASARIKDITKIEGVRDNQLIGYGLVVGLPGTGDRLQNAPFTERSLVSMLERLGVAITDEDMRTRNAAAVIVTANLPGFSRNGDRIDVSVSALGDARSLRGGTLLVTPLTGADGHVYAVAQGPLIISGYEAGGQAATTTKGVPTAARIPNGGTVERELAFPLNSLGFVRFILKNPDFVTARRIANAINQQLDGHFATSVDLATIEVQVPSAYHGQVTDFLAEIETIEVETDEVARVVVDENSGTIVIGSNVRISQVAVTQGAITIEVSETPLVSQPAPFSGGGGGRRGGGGGAETVVVPRTSVNVEEGNNGFQVLDAPVTLQDLVNALNALGVPPSDVIAILQTIKTAGALHAELIIQ